MKSTKAKTKKKISPKSRAVLGKTASLRSSVVVRELGIRDYENWRQTYTLLGAARNEWDEGAWKQSELTRPKFRELLKRESKLRKQDQRYSYGVFNADDGMLVGLVYVMDVSRGIFQSAFLGYRVFNPFWGQGFAIAAVKQTLQIAFLQLKLHRLEAGISPKNKASIQVANAAGLRQEGLSRRRLLVNGKWVDLLIYAATCEDFGLKYHK